MVNNINKDVLIKVVAEWLEEWEFPSLISRNNYNINPENLNQILAIIGPRRAGKTYFMYELIQGLIQSKKYSKKDILFIDFEDFRLSGLKGNNIDELFEVFYQLTNRYPHFLFFDEVQNLLGWSRILRTLHNKRRFKIIISGSNSRLLGNEIATELRGRYRDIRMLPFSFAEYIRYKGVSFNSVKFHTAAKGGILSAFNTYLRHGGFPEVVIAGNDIDRKKLLKSYYKTIFYRDIIERYNIKARYILDSLMNEFLETYSGIFSISNFEKQLRVNSLAGSKRTIANYFHYLQEAFFIITTDKFSYSPRIRAMNPKKVYLTDTGFTILGQPFSGNRGRILENVVAIALFRRETDIYYFKGKGECDFIIKNGTRATHALQVCWELTAQNRKREISGLVEACSALKLSSGIILTYDQTQEEQINAVKIVVLPVWKWLLSDNFHEL